MGNENSKTSRLSVLDKHLLSFGKGSASWTVGHAVEGVQIFGGIGSGKTSGSGRTLALSYLKAGFGGLVLTVKPDEAEMWKTYCDLTGRTRDRLVIEPGGVYRFDFLDYEAGLGGTENVVEVLKTVIRASQGGGGLSNNDRFWDDALEILLVHVTDLCRLAYGTVSVRHLYDIVQSLPSPERTDNIPGKDETAYQTALRLADNDLRDRFSGLDRDAPDVMDVIKDIERDERRLDQAVQFFEVTYKHLSDKTRSVVDFSFAAFLFRLLRDPFASLFCSGTSTLTPEDCLRGKIIILNLPVKLFNKVGKDVQIMFKFIWQRAMERRRVDQDSKPVFLWSDEAQNFLHEHDAVYQATARSSLIATVYISQNIANYRASMGGQAAADRVHGLLGTLSTKIFHANADTGTNDYASKLIGNRYVTEISTSKTSADGQTSKTESSRITLKPRVRPEDFIILRTSGTPDGAKPDRSYTEAIVHVQGHLTDPVKGHFKTLFDQKYTP